MRSRSCGNKGFRSRSFVKPSTSAIRPGDAVSLRLRPKPQDNAFRNSPPAGAVTDSEARSPSQPPGDGKSHFKKRGHALRRSRTARYTLMKQLQQDYPLTIVCQVFNIGRSGYYVGRKRQCATFQFTYCNKLDICSKESWDHGFPVIGETLGGESVASPETHADMSVSE